jgi:hypothetical protein
VEISNPISSVADLGSKLIDRFIPDPAKKREAKQELKAMQQSGELRRLEARMGAIKAEAQSKDPWTSRARPSFMYVIYLVILVNCVIAPFASIFFPDATGVYFQNIAQGFDAIPGEVWATFTAGYLGYTGARTYEKNRGVTR